MSRILFNNPHQNPIIYLQNIDRNTLKMLKDFIYNGEIQVPLDFVNDIIKMGTKIGILGVNDDMHVQTAKWLKKSQKCKLKNINLKKI